MYRRVGILAHGRMGAREWARGCTHRVKVQRDFDRGAIVAALRIRDAELEVTAAHT